MALKAKYKQWQGTSEPSMIKGKVPSPDICQCQGLGSRRGGEYPGRRSQGGVGGAVVLEWRGGEETSQNLEYPAEFLKVPSFFSKLFL